jgi:hypothetical protein
MASLVLRPLRSQRVIDLDHGERSEPRKIKLLFVYFDDPPHPKGFQTNEVTKCAITSEDVFGVNKNSSETQ